MDAFSDQVRPLRFAHSFARSHRIGFIGRTESVWSSTIDGIRHLLSSYRLRSIGIVILVLYTALGLSIGATPVHGQISLAPAPVRPTEAPGVVSRGAAEEGASRNVGDSTTAAGPLEAPIGKPRERRQPGSGATFALPDSVGRNTILALGTVLVLFLGVVWLMRKAQPRAFSALPKEAIEILGRISLDGRQHLQLIRLGRKVVLFGVGPQGVMPLTEVDDPQEVEQLLTACKSRQPGSASDSFRQILASSERDSARGFLRDDSGESSGTERVENSRGRGTNAAPRRRRSWLEA